MTSRMPPIAVSRPVFDDSAFPVVLLAGAGGHGHAFAWGAAMRGLLARRQPFVIVEDSAQGVEHPADRQARRCWIRTHACELQTYCLGLVGIERDLERRSQTRVSLSELVEPAGLRSLVVSTEPLARQLAGVLLMGARPAAPAPDALDVRAQGDHAPRAAPVRRLLSVQ
ncbi:MAG: hypothetical protein ACRYHA_04975 [Janthinobacterium lividum]